MSTSSRFAAGLALAALAALTALAGCSSVDPTATITIDGPAFGTDGADFRPVSGLIELRCGTLDCHGSTYRPLRIYGQKGLRMPVEKPEDFMWGDYAGYYSGGPVGTTPDELLNNYRSMLALEPDLTEQVFKGELDPGGLTLVRKPRLQEKHKGGAVWLPGGNNDRCLTQWLKGEPVGALCGKEEQ